MASSIILPVPPAHDAAPPSSSPGVEDYSDCPAVSPGIPRSHPLSFPLQRKTFPGKEKGMTLSLQETGNQNVKVSDRGRGMKRHIPHRGVEKRCRQVTEKKQSAIAALPSRSFFFMIMTAQIFQCCRSLDGNFPKNLAGEKNFRECLHGIFFLRERSVEPLPELRTGGSSSGSLSGSRNCGRMILSVFQCIRNLFQALLRDLFSGREGVFSFSSGLKSVKKIPLRLAESRFFGYINYS